jgi:hypothetical protein
MEIVTLGFFGVWISFNSFVSLLSGMFSHLLAFVRQVILGNAVNVAVDFVGPGVPCARRNMSPGSHFVFWSQISPFDFRKSQEVRNNTARLSSLEIEKVP